jgi:CYTH domain-containing protein
MPTEIERKFLVTGDRWRVGAVGAVFRQGYIAADESKSVRVRVVGDRGFLTIKGKTVGVARTEFEYGIPVDEALEMLHTLCEPPLIEKTRYRIEYAGLLWEVDEFEGENRGLILAEVELTHANQQVDLPDWVAEEVSHDPRYYNANLAKHPYSRWGKDDKE